MFVDYLSGGLLEVGIPITTVYPVSRTAIHLPRLSLRRFLVSSESYGHRVDQIKSINHSCQTNISHVGYNSIVDHTVADTDVYPNN